MVGVGISSPQKQMHIHNPNNISLDDEISSDLQPGPKGLQMKSESALLLTNKNSGSAATDGLLIRSTNNNAYIYLQEAGNLEILTKKPLRFKMESNGNVAIGTVQTNYFVVKETGKIGIKTSDPTATFDINGDLRIRQGASENYVLTSNSDGTGQWKEIKLALNGNTLSLVNHNTQVDLSGFNQTLSLVDQSLQLSNGGGSVALNNLNYWSKTGSMIYYNLGNVGIGIDNPSATLHIKKNTTQSENYYKAFQIDVNNNLTKSFVVYNSVNSEEVFRIWGNGSVNAKGIYAQQFKVKAQFGDYYWPDYVFNDDYVLMELSQLKSFINENQHLPNVPSKDEVAMEGVDLGEMTTVLLQKIEELTLYIIKQDEQIKELKNEMNILKEDQNIQK
jgi:hypothetical protein